MPARRAPASTSAPRTPEIVWSSPDELVIWKPPGMASEQSNDPHAESAIERIRRAGYANAKLPHRLDRIARGLLLIALTDDSIAHHGRQVAEREWTKWYAARLTPAPGINPDALLGPHRAYLKRRGPKAELVRAGGQPARHEVIAAQANHHAGIDALIHLETGRYHQIRAMMASADAPVAGDALYTPDQRSPPGGPYLEHVALTFTPCHAEHPLTVSALAHGHRPRLAPDILYAIHRIARGQPPTDAAS